MPRDLPLTEVHRALTRSFTEVGAFTVPADYGDHVAEHRALRESAGLIDRTALGRAVATGRDRAAFLQGMLTNDVKGLAAGQGCAAAFLDAHGKVMSLLAVYALPDQLWIEAPVGTTDKLLQLLDKYLISEKVEFESADDAFVVLAVQGPAAPALIEKLSGQPVPAAPYAHVEATLAGIPARVINRPEGTPPGVHCWTEPQHGAALWRALAEAGAVPVGHTALDVLRVEAGVPWYGIDVDDTVIMPEAQSRLESLVHYQKGCYIGQEVVARVKYRGHVNRALSGLVVEGDRVPAAGAAVVADGKEVGRITSAVRSLALGKPIALGYVRREHFAPGTAVTVQDGETTLPARIAALPFA
jgi:folate-binding protein YgfZ